MSHVLHARRSDPLMSQRIYMCIACINTCCSLAKLAGIIERWLIFASQPRLKLLRQQQHCQGQNMQQGTSSTGCLLFPIARTRTWTPFTSFTLLFYQHKQWQAFQLFSAFQGRQLNYTGCFYHISASLPCRAGHHNTRSWSSCC